MEGIFYRTAEGKEIPIKEVQGLAGSGALIIQMSCMMRPMDAEKIRRRLEEQTGVRVILLENAINKIMRLAE